MSKIIYAFALLILTNMVYAQAPTASFNTSPSVSGGLITICQGSTVTFNNTSSQTTAGATYTWTFGTGASPAIATGIGPHVVTYSTATAPTTSAMLTVNNNNGQAPSVSMVTIDVNATPISNLTLASVGGGYGTTTQNGLIFFKNCGAIDSSLFNFNSTYNSGVTQTFTWGDGATSNQTNMTGSQISHIYPLGQYTLTHTVTINGCSTSKNYIVFNGNAPVVTVSGSGQTTCLPSPYSIDILSNDVPINYTVNFSDGSPSLVFTTDNDTTISHIFVSSSCGVDYVFAPGFPPIQNAFSATIIAQNICSNNGLPTVVTVGPITINTGASAAFDYNPNSPICQGEPVTFDNQSSGGQNVTSTGCDSTYSYYWQVDQTTGYTVTAGSLGSNNGFVGNLYDYTQWTNGTDNMELTFSVPGSYNVWMYAANFCGVDSIMQVVTINPTASVNMTFYNQMICSGDSSALFIMTSTVPGYVITWEITDTTNVTGVTTMTGSGVSPVTFNPLTLFNTTTQAGTVEISASVGCTNVAPVVHTITVNPQGNLNVDPTAQTICSGDATSIAISSNLSNATFTWTASAPSTIGGESAGSGNSIAQVLTNTGTTVDTVVYTISIGTVLCPGPDIIVNVAVQPQITMNSNTDFTVCPGTQINPNDYITTPTGATISWTNNNTNIGIGSSGNGQIPTWNGASNTTGATISGTIDVSAQLGACPGVQDQFVVNILPSPVFNYTLSPSTGLDCITNTGVILGTVNPVNSSVSWSGPTIVSGANTLSPVVGGPGQYFVTVTDNVNGCITTDMVQIDPPTPINITGVSVTNVSCYGGSNGVISITTDNSGVLTYNWSPSQLNSPSVSGLSIGNYSVQVVNNDGCTADTSITITQPLPLTVAQVDSVGSECKEFNGSLSVIAQGGQAAYSYVWETGENGAVAHNIDAGNHTVQVTDAAGCVVSATFDLGCTELIPVVINQFLSPNNDGKNELWVIDYLLSQYPDIHVTVYNRWGSVVFEAQPYQNDWNGHYKGTAANSLPASTYFYVIDTNKKSQDPYTGYLEIQP